MGSKAADTKTSKQDEELHHDTSDDTDQSELGQAISKAVTQVLESSDWRALSFPLQANSGKHSKGKNAVKRPMNPFMLYAQAARKKLSVVYPDISYAKLSKTLGRIWKSLDQEEKQPFVDESERLRQKHKIDHPDYKFQPKRRHKKRPQSPSHVENARISTGDVLKALGSNGSTHVHASQNLWAQTIANGFPQQQSNTNQRSANRSMTPPPPPPPYSRSDAIEENAKTSLFVPKLNTTPSYGEPNQLPSTSSNFVPPYDSRYINPPPPPLHRATTASLFSPANYMRVSKTEANDPSYTQLNDIQFPPTTTIQNYPSDLSLAIGNSFLKCSPQIARPTHHLASSEDMNQNHLLTGVNHILRDMFGSERNSVL